MGRAAAVEVMISTAFIRDCIVDKDKTSMINGAIAAGTSQYGMQTFDQAIFGLYSEGIVTLDESLRWATNVDDFKLKVSGISTTSEMARDDMAAKLAHPAVKPGAAPAAKPPAKSGAPDIQRFGGR
jgi:twitching motility protein PilT